MTPFIPFFIMLVVGSLLVYVGTRSRMRESRHQRTLRHIAQLERELGLQPDPTVDLVKSLSRAHTQIMRGPYSFRHTMTGPARELEFANSTTPKEEVNLGPNVGVRLIDVPAGQLPPK